MARTLEFGLFNPIANNGWIMSTASSMYKPSFEMNKEVTEKAEQYGFDFAFSMVKFKGYGGETEFWDWALEPFTMMAGLAAVTDRVRIISSVALPTLHPALCARMAVTIDDITGGTGRCGINIVSGWNKLEYSQYGMWPGDQYYQERYDYAEEYVHVLRELWGKGRVTYKGRFFELDDAQLLPQPRSAIQIVCAGQSDRGMRFTAKLGDRNFIIGDLDTVGGINRKVKEFAAEFGREDEVGTYALYTVVMADTDEEAEAANQRYVDGGDVEALRVFASAFSADAEGGTAKMLRQHAYIGIPTVVGSPDTVARFFNELADTTGVDGVLVTFPDFPRDIVTFGERVLPQVESRNTVLT